MAIKILMVNEVSTLGKFVALLIIMAFILSGLTLVNASEKYSEYSVPSLTSAPSVPEFTVKLVDRSYDVPTTTTNTIDQYTGKETITTQQGYHVQKRIIEITIKNQPFTSQHFSGFGSMSEDSEFFLNIRAKGHYINDWSTPSPIAGNSLDVTHFMQDNSEYTVVECYANYPENAEVDFQVQATIGYYKIVFSGENTMPTGKAFTVLGQSEWSAIQTLKMGKVDSIAIPDTSETIPTQTTIQQPTINPTQTTTQTKSSTDQIIQVGAVFGFDNAKDIIAIMGVIIVILFLALIVSNKRKSGIRKPEVLG